MLFLYLRFTYYVYYACRWSRLYLFHCIDIVVVSVVVYSWVLATFGRVLASRGNRGKCLLTDVCICVNAERDQAASMSTALPTYSFDNVGGSFAAHGSSFAAAAADSGRYIQDDLPLTTVLLPDGTSVPMSSFAAANSALFTSPGMVNGGATTGLSASQAQQMVGQMMDSVIPGSDSLNLAGNINISGTLTSDDLTQYLQNGSMLTEMRSDEFLRQFDGIVFQQTNDSAAGPPPSSEQWFCKFLTIDCCCCWCATVLSYNTDETVWHRLKTNGALFVVC